jgi:Na+-driven multidrug efflux pump
MPAGIQGIVFSLSNLLVQNAINSLGPEAMAASAAAFIIELNRYCLIHGLGQTTTTFVGQNCGAKNLSRCFDITRQALAFLCSKSPKTKEPQKRKRRKRK